jgi:hypothetical protein
VNVTVPVGVKAGQATVAVNVTASPLFDGFFDDVSVTAPPAVPTTYTNAVEVEAAQLPSPE